MDQARRDDSRAEPGGTRRAGNAEIAVRLERWIDPAAHGFYSGDHHIHAAGCAHYTSPTEGVDPADMFRQVKGEGLNVGSVLTWGPGFDHQQQFFAPAADKRSEPLTLMKYDIEVSGFGSEALGHVVPAQPEGADLSGRDGQQGLADVDASGAALDEGAGRRRRLRAFRQRPADRSGGRDHAPARAARREQGRQARPPPRLRAACCRNRLPRSTRIATGSSAEAELKASHDRADDQLPNFAIPELNSVGAQEIFVTAAHGVADFISAMDTDRIREWNAWYHLMNCRAPGEGERRDGLPVHERHARRARAAATSSSGSRAASTTRSGAEASRAAAAT